MNLSEIFDELENGVVMLNEHGYKVAEYKSMAKCKLYTGINEKTIRTLITTKHKKPYYWERGKQNIYLRKKSDFEKHKDEFKRTGAGCSN